MFNFHGVGRRRSRKEPSRVVRLADWNKGGDSVTAIARPDALLPVPHTMPAIDPEVADARLMVTQLIADLAKRGALDAGTDDVLDYWIDKQKQEWIGLVKVQADSRRETLERLLAQHVQNLVQAATVLAELRERTETAEAAVAHYRDQLVGHQSSVAPPTHRADFMAEPTVPLTPELPRGHLSAISRQSAAGTQSTGAGGESRA